MIRERMPRAITLLCAVVLVATDVAAQDAPSASARDLASFSAVPATGWGPLLRSEAGAAAEAKRSGRRSSRGVLPAWLFRAVNATEGAGVFAVNRAMPVQFMIVDSIDLTVPAALMEDTVRFIGPFGAPPIDPDSGEADTDARKLRMSPGTLDFNRAIEQVLDDEVARVEGKRDAAGNLMYDYGTLNPFDDNPVFDERPVSRPIVQGLVLKREHVSTMFDKFATQLEGIQDLSDEDRLRIARDLLENAGELQDARLNMLVNEPSQYDRYGRPIFRDADAFIAYNYRRGVYFNLLGENPLLAIYGDFTVLGGDQYFHEALYHNFLTERHAPRTAAERKEFNDDLLDLFDTALDEGVANARGEADRIAGLNTFTDLLELAGPEYALADQQLRDNAAVFDTDYVDNLLGTVQGEFGTIKAIDAPRELFISTVLATGAVISSIVIPGSGGVVLTVVFAGADVGIEGTKLWKMEGQLDREREAGAVLGFGHLGELEDATDDQRTMAFAAALFGVVDATTLTQIGRASRGVGAADDVGGAVEAGRVIDRPVGVPEDMAEAPTVIDRVPRESRGPRTERMPGAPTGVAADVGGMTDEELAFWRARPATSEDEIQAMDALVRQARSDASDIPHQTIDEALELIEERAARNPAYGTMEALDDLGARLGVAEMDAEGHVLAVRTRIELAEFAEETGGAIPRNVVEIDVNGLSDLKAKAAIASDGRPVTNWTATDRALAEEVLADEDFYGHLFDWVSDESGLQQVFSEADFANLRQAFPEFVPAGRLDDASAAARAIDDTPTFLDRPRRLRGDAAGDAIDETPTVLDRPRRLEDDDAFRDAPTERDFSVEDETPTVLDRAPRPAGIGVDENGVVTLDLLELGWKLPGAAGEVIQVGNDADASDAAAPIEVYITSDGGSTGEVMSLSVLNNGEPIRLQGEGLVLEPVAFNEDETAAVFDRLEQLGGQLVMHKLSAYCMQFLADVPVAGQLFRIAPPDAQEAYAGMRSVLGASKAIRDQLNPDSDRDGYFHSTRQWAIWTRERSLTGEQFGEAFLEHTRRNVEGSGQAWTRDIEEAVRSLVPNRWRDVQKVLAQADAAAASGG